jgi:anti-anti-sigma regulatory factor
LTAFDLSDNRLTVTGALDQDSEAGLRRALSDLLLTDSAVVEIDLREVHSITSLCIGAVVATWIDLHACDRRLQVLPSQHVLRIFDTAGITQVFDIVTQP